MDLKLRKPEEVVALLCERLRKERLYLEITQADVAGIGVNTVSNLEAGRNVSFENLVRINYQLSRIIYCINLIPSTFEIQSVITRPTAQVQVQVQNLYLCREILKKWFVQTLHVNSVWALLHKYVSI